MRNLSLATLFLLLVFIASVAFAGGSVRVNNVVVNENPSLSFTKFGYNVQNCSLSNNSNEQKVVEFKLKIGESFVTKKIALAPEESKYESFYFPANNEYYRNDLEVFVDGEKGTIYPEQRNPNQELNILIDPSLPEKVYDLVYSPESDEVEAKKGKAKIKEKLFSEAMCLFDGGTDQLPAMWQAYLQFNAILLDSVSLKLMEKKTKDAVFDYVRTGGLLVLLGHEFSLPNECTVAEQDSNSIVYELGTGFVICLKNINSSFFKKKKNSNSQLMIDEYAKYTQPIIKRYLRNRSSLNPIVEFSNEENLAYNPDVVSFLAAFIALLIGPLNVYLLYRRKKLIFVFLTIPVISVIICLGFFSYYYLFESNVLNIKKYAFVYLNEGEGQANIQMNYGIFSGKDRNYSSGIDSFSSNKENLLEFPNSAAVLPVGMTSYRYKLFYGDIEIGATQKFTRNWIKSKNIEEFRIFDVEKSRERIDIIRENGLKAFNGLGADIKRFFYRDFDGNVYEAKSIKEGQSVVLSQCGIIPSKTTIVKEIYFDDFLWFDTFKNVISKSPLQFLQNGQYYAELSSMPYLKQNMEKYANVSETVYLVGIKKGDKL